MLHAFTDLFRLSPTGGGKSIFASPGILCTAENLSNRQCNRQGKVRMQERGDAKLHPLSNRRHSSAVPGREDVVGARTSSEICAAGDSQEGSGGEGREAPAAAMCYPLSQPEGRRGGWTDCTTADGSSTSAAARDPAVVELLPPGDGVRFLHAGDSARSGGTRPASPSARRRRSSKPVVERDLAPAALLWRRRPSGGDGAWWW
jgi:hypothetical protein